MTDPQLASLGSCGSTIESVGKIHLVGLPRQSPQGSWPCSWAEQRRAFVTLSVFSGQPGCARMGGWEGHAKPRPLRRPVSAAPAAASKVPMPERALALIPEALSFEQATCLPLAGLTAWQVGTAQSWAASAG